eukprot:210118_1
MEIQQLDAIWNKYEAEYHMIPSSAERFRNYCKSIGKPIKFIDARNYYKLRKEEIEASETSNHKTLTNKNKNKNKKNHKRNSSVPQLSTFTKECQNNNNNNTKKVKKKKKNVNKTNKDKKGKKKGKKVSKKEKN